MDARVTPGGPGGPGGEGVLANFFNSLLSKKSNVPSSPGSLTGLSRAPTNDELTPDRSAMRTDATAELDRLAKMVQRTDEHPSQSEP